MITIQLNGKAKTITTDLTISHLLHQESLANKRIAVEVNQQIMPRSMHGQYVIKPGDVIEIVHAIGGG